MKKLPSRACAVLLVVAGTSFGVGTASAADASLEIMRDERGNVSQIVSLASWRYDAARSAVIATSTDGTRRCGSAGAPPRAGSAKMLVLDGYAYPLESVQLNSFFGPDVRVRPSASGVFPICAPTGTPGSVSVFASSKGTPLSLDLDVIPAGANSSTVRTLPLPPGSDIRYNPISSLTTVTIPATLLCLEAQGSTGNNVLITDSNNQLFNFNGVRAVNFLPFQGMFTLDASDGLLCFEPTDTVTAALPTPLPDAEGPPACEFSFEAGNRIFATGFENTDPPLDNPGVLEFSARLVRSPALEGPVANRTMKYEYWVRNCGGEALNGVAVREFWPGTAGMASVAVQQDSVWSRCSASDGNCVASTSGNTNYISDTIPTLAPVGQPGSTFVYRAERAGTGSAGSLIRLDAVALVNDGSRAVPSNVAGSWQVELLQNSNIAPTWEVTQGVLPDQTDPVLLAEDGDTVPLTGFTLEIADTDSGFACDSGECIRVVQSVPADAVLLDATYQAVDGNSRGTVTFTATPAPNAFGPVRLELQAVDADGAGSTTFDIHFDIAPQDDAPSFSVGLINVQPGNIPLRSIQVTPETYCGMTQADGPTGPFTLEDVECATQRWTEAPSFPDNRIEVSSWIINASPGPGEESLGQSVLLSARPINPPDLSILDEQRFLFDDKTGMLVYELGGDEGTALIEITATDTATPEPNITVVNIPVIVGFVIPTDPPVVAEPSITANMSRPETLLLSTLSLGVSDPDSADNEVIFELVNTLRLDSIGVTLENDGQALQVGDTFTLADVVDGSMALVAGANGDSDTGRIEFAIRDAAGNPANSQLRIVIDI